MTETESSTLENAIETVARQLKERKRALDEREKELEKLALTLGKEKQTLGFGEPGDVLHLNVGGTVLTTLRRTLTTMEGSMLAAKFSGRWDESMEKDREGNYFIDQPIELFLPMLDCLRRKASHTSFGPPIESPGFASFFGRHQKKYLDFVNMVEYYGMTLAIYPIELVPHRPEAHNGVSIQYDGGDIDVVSDDWTLLQMRLVGHSRHVKGFDVILKEVENMQVGWLLQGSCDNTDCVALQTGVGSHSSLSGIAIDCSRNGILSSGEFTKFENDVSIQNGSTVRCQKVDSGEEYEWLVDGVVVPPKHSAVKDAVPAISCKGRFRIANIELFHL